MTRKCDAIIVGAGYLGMISAIGLASRGFEVLLLERRPYKPTSASTTEPCRLFAISEGSLQVISSLCEIDITNLGQHINGIVVQEFSNGAFLDFNPKQLNMHNFGIMIEESALMDALHERASHVSGIKSIQISEVRDIENTDDYAVVHTDVGSWKGDIVLACDGKFSEVRDLLGIDTTFKSYDQHGVIADITHEKSHHGVAIENFTPQGPFAILPKKGGHESSIVWTLRSDLADGVKKLDKAQVVNLIRERMFDVFGKIELKSDVRSYPLDLKYATKYNVGRFYLLGDALHAIHPLAGQGLNLSIRDADFLINNIIKAKELGLDIGANGLLMEYFKNRSFDNQVMIESTNLLNGLFSNNNSFLRAFRSLGLDAVQEMPWLKKLFILYACGLMSL